MPLMKYFCFVGTGLVLLLIGIGWCFPQSASDSVRSDKERPTIRINSAERLPERVVIDTTLPTIVPPPNISYAASATVVETVQPRPNAFAELATASPAKAKASGEVPQTKHVSKREPAKKVVVAHRPPQPLNIAPSPTQIVQGTPTDTRMSLIETLKERLAQIPQLLEAQTH